MPGFKLNAPYKPTGDQPQAIEALVKGFKEGSQRCCIASADLPALMFGTF